MEPTAVDAVCVVVLIVRGSESAYRDGTWGLCLLALLIISCLIDSMCGEVSQKKSDTEVETCTENSKYQNSTIPRSSDICSRTLF